MPKVPKTPQANFKAMMAIDRESAPGPYDTRTKEAGKLAETEKTNDSGDQSDTKKPCKKGGHV